MTSQRPATLSVADTRRVLLSKEICRRLGLKAGHRIELIPPARRGGTWLLDIRPRVGKPLTHTPSTRPTFFCAHHISRDVLHDGTHVRRRIKLELAEEVADTPGLYQVREV